jgi:hypothetical protein
MRDSLFWELIMPEERLGMQIYLYLTDRGRTGYNVSCLDWYITLAQWKLAVLYEYGRRRAAAGRGDPYYDDPTQVRAFLRAAHRTAGLALCP